MHHAIIRAALVATLCASAAAHAVPVRKAGTSRPAPLASSPRIIPLPLELVIAPTQRICTAKTASGLGYRILRDGAGARPAAEGQVRVDYIGYFAANGRVFDQSTGAIFPVQRVIPGFSEGVQLMPRGAVYRFCIPAELGYGATDKGPIPANSALVFQVEMRDPDVPPTPVTIPPTAE